MSKDLNPYPHSSQGTMYDDDDTFSVVSTATGTDATSITAPTVVGHETDDFDLLDTDDDDDDGDDGDDGGGGGDDDDDDTESAFQNGRWDLASGCSTSLPPSIYEDEVVHGRRYHGFRRGIYPLPNDEVERRREETVHAMVLQLMGGHLFYSNIGEEPQKIIDIGTGTGIWAIDVADRYPNANVIGTDLSPIQPACVPINVRMFIEDCEEPEWLHGSEYDLIHFRQMTGALRDSDALLGKIYPHVRNGGWVEFHELIPQIHCDDGTMTDDDPLRVFNETVEDGMRVYGFNKFRLGDIEGRLERAGFTNIHCITKKVPVSTWPRDKHLRALGVFMKTILSDSLEALAAKPLVALNMTKEERAAMVAAARTSLDDNSIHRHINFCVCYGQKREGSDFSQSVY